MNKHPRGVPQQSARKMATDLARAYWRPIAVAKENLALAKTRDQIKYWTDVVFTLTQ